ncbi:MAG TPA: DUF3054 domain-containing protein [Acidimicrobiales bacterium]|nr:DUF3054 domain-containing protein [Acidimicrobiales bacterium]
MRRPALAAVAVDITALVLFVIIGRASHDHGETLAGFASTCWPFAVGLVAGETAAGRLASGRPLSARAGAVVTVSTVAVGMVLRVVAGQGTAVAFIVVALVFLGGAMTAGRAALRWMAGRLAPASERHREGPGRPLRS